MQTEKAWAILYLHVGSPVCERCDSSGDVVCAGCSRIYDYGDADWYQPKDMIKDIDLIWVGKHMPTETEVKDLFRERWHSAWVKANPGAYIDKDRDGSPYYWPDNKDNYQGFMPEYTFDGTDIWTDCGVCCPPELVGRVVCLS